MWHWAHAVTFPAGAIWCELVSGKPVELWSKIAFAHEVVLWQVEHCEIGNPEEM
jgi:hypothetical protein